MQFSLKRCFHIFGSVLGLFGVMCVVTRLYSYSDKIDLTRFNATTWLLIAMLTVLYGAVGNSFLVQAWWQLLAFFDLNVQRSWALKAYGLSQIAKYVPGNVFHLAGRQALGMAVGLPGVSLAKSVFWDLALQASTAAFFGVLATLLARTQLDVVAAVAILFATSVAATVALYRAFAPQVGVAFASQICYLTVSSLVFVGALKVIAISSYSSAVIFPVFAAYVLAWLAGFVTPGAPAGVGVRELVLLFLLKGMLNESDLLLALVLGRFVTVLGDSLFFIYAYFSPKPINPMTTQAK